MSRIALRLVCGWVAAMGILMVTCSASEPTRTVHLVPLGDFPTPMLKDLSDYGQSRFALTVRTHAPMTPGTDSTDPSRRQLIAEELITRIKRGYPALASDPRAVLIGLTSDDMYARAQPNWQFVFGWRQEGRFAVMSSARLDPRALGEIPDDELFRARLRKTLTRYLGFLYYGFPPSDDRSSVLYRTVLGVDDLDLIGDAFAPEPPSTDRGAVNVRSYRLPDGGRLELQVPVVIRVSVSRRPDPAPALSLWFLPGRGDHFEARMNVGRKGAPAPHALRGAIEALRRKALAGATETTLTVEELKGKDVEGYYFTVADKSAPNVGARYATLAVLRVGTLLVTVAMRHQDKDPTEGRLLLDMLKAARDVAGN